VGLLSRPTSIGSLAPMRPDVVRAVTDDDNNVIGHTINNGPLVHINSEAFLGGTPMERLLNRSENCGSWGRWEDHTELRQNQV
jgi:hypothetical protein